jgi:outer membrane protein TolC
MSPSLRRRRVLFAIPVIVLILGAAPLDLEAQESSSSAGSGPVPVVDAARQPSTAPATPIRSLIDELLRRSPTVAVAQAMAAAARQVPPQVATLPDPTISIQQFNVGSPRPFAGFTNSDFAYIGVGISQDLPFPGKLRLRGEVATRAAATSTAHVDVVRLEAIERLEAAYARLAYLEQTLEILQQDDALARQAAVAADAQYRVGQGTQQDMLRAQLQHTKALSEIATNHQQTDDVEVDLKAALHRPQDSADIVAEPLTLLPWPADPAGLLAQVQDRNATLHEDAAMVDARAAEVALAQKGGRPDFTIGYTYQHTSNAFRDYYMLTFDVRLPRHSRVTAAIAEASAKVDDAQAEHDADVQAVLADVARQAAVARAGEAQVSIYRDGLIPQARASFEAGLVAYQSGHQTFEAVLGALGDVQTFEMEYQRILLERALAVARLERLMGGPQS